MLRFKTGLRALAATLLTTTAAMTIMSTPAAAQRAGIAEEVNATTRALNAAGTEARFVETRGAIFSGDNITTNASGQAQIRFLDDTRIVVGPNAQLTIDQFVFDTNSTAQEIAVNAVKGAFRFITGRSAKDAYLIQFPAGTIGIRGTELDLTVLDDGTGIIALWDGAYRVCDFSTPRRNCWDEDDQCSVLIVRPNGDFEEVRNLRRKIDLVDEEFPYAFTQQRVNRPYWVSSGVCEAQRQFTPERDLGITDPTGPITPPAPPLGDDDDDGGNEF